METNTSRNLQFISLGGGATTAMEKLCDKYPDARFTAIINGQRDTKSEAVTYHDINTDDQTPLIQQLAVDMKDSSYTCIIMAGIGGTVSKSMLVGLWTEMKRNSFADYYIIAFHPLKVEGAYFLQKASSTEYHLISDPRYFSVNPNNFLYFNNYGQLLLGEYFRRLDAHYGQMVEYILNKNS